MNNRLILTSFVAIAVASPAMAALPTYMTTNQTYEGEATNANMGVYENNATATAEAYYQILPGYYLPAGSYTASSCTANFYCPGATNVTKNDTEVQGREQCPAGYISSDSGSNSIADCYTSCPASLDHMVTGATVTGRMYYGNLNNCAVSACTSGYVPMNENIASTFGSQTSSSTHLDDSAVDSSAWLVSFSAGDLGGGWACKNSGTYYTNLQPVTRAELESMSSGNDCYCWINKVKGRDASSMAVPVTRDLGTCSTSCKAACANAIAGNNDVNFDRATLFEHASNISACVGDNFVITYKCSDTSQSALRQQNVVFGDEYTTLAYNSNTCSKLGYTFDGVWMVSDTNDTVAVDTKTTYNYPENKTFTGKWTPNTLTINIDKNGGTGTCAGATGVTAGSFTCLYDDTCTAPNWNQYSCNIANTNRTLTGWNTAADGTGTSYALGADIKNIISSGSITLYAVWSDTCASATKGTNVDTATYNGVENNQCTYTHTCEVGYYNTNNGVKITASSISCDACTNAPANAHYTSNGSAANGCGFHCDAGYYVPDDHPSMDVCDPVGVGFWSDGNGVARNACTTFRAHTTTLGTTSTSSNACLCEAGMYLNGNSCAVVDNGYYSLISNESVECPAGASGSDKGRDEQSDCFYTCPSKTVANASSVTAVNAKEYYSGSAYPTCTYNAECVDSGFVLSGNGTADPLCTGNEITLSWANGGHGTAPTTPARCTYGGTFDMPAALTATGYTFNKWNVNSKTFDGGQASVICNSTNLGVTSGSATITASWTTNKINIIWDGIENANVQTADDKAMTNFDATNHTAQSQVEYDGAIYTPKAAMAPEGQEFVGWKFSK